LFLDVLVVSSRIRLVPGCGDGKAAPQARVALEFSGFCRRILLPSRTTPRGVVFT
jgi:hypothetical protein